MLINFNAIVNNFLSFVQSISSNPWVEWILRLLALSQAIRPAGWPASYYLTDGEKFDFIVVGAGSGGAVVATRLSEVYHWRVLLLEAGGDPPPASVAPSLFGTMAHTETDWDYKGYLDPGIGQAHPDGFLYLTRGKMLGGSSSNNYEIYSRGSPADYEDWNQVAPGWDWDTVLHYYKKLECMTDPMVFQNPRNAHFHSTSGPVRISRPRSNKYYEKVDEIVFNSLSEMGIKRLMEMNGPEMMGASRPHFTFANGRRSSTAEAYLLPARNRPNLHVTKFARVMKLLIDPQTSTAYGVQVRLGNGHVVKVYADKEVIVSAGSYDSPKLLMLSGIGPREELNKFHIPVIADLPVGKNLHDHQVIPIVISGKMGLDTAVQNVMVTSELDSYPMPIQTGYFRLNHSFDYNYKEQQPQFQIFNTRVGATGSPFLLYGCRATANFDFPYCHSISSANLLREIDFMAVVLMHPLSRGQVTLRSRNPFDNPVIHLGFFRNKRDIYTAAEGTKFMSQYAETSYFRHVGGKLEKIEVAGCEGLRWRSDEYWRCYVRNTVVTLLHPVGTCAMGPNGVVDERLRVHGVMGLRIVDASVMPKITSGNTNAPTMMIGEKAADMIKSDYGVFHEMYT